MGRKNSILKNLFFSLITLFIFLGFGEGVARLFGAKSISDEKDPYVGFSNQSKLFTQQLDSTKEKSVFATSKNKIKFFNYQEFSTEKSDNTFRIFTLGGSTTYGRPYSDLTSFSSWMREILSTTHSELNWEVINAGGISYASYRIAKLVEELIKYKPDLFVLYTGHNEFLEERTYREVKKINPIFRELNSTFSKSAAYSALARMLRKEKLDPPPTQDEIRLQSEVNTILDNTIGPSSYQRNDTLRRKVLEHFEFSIQKILATAQKQNIPVLVVNPPANIRNCAPFKSELSKNIEPSKKELLDRLIKSSKALMDSNRIDEAIDSLNLASRIDFRYAKAKYLLAQAYFTNHNQRKAKIYFKAALDDDICALRIKPAFQNTLQSIAEKNNAPFINFQKILEEDSRLRFGHDILGEEYFLDHVHLNIEAHKLLAFSVLDELMDKKIIPQIKLTSEQLSSIQKKLMDKVDIKTHGIALHNLAKVLNWTGKHDEAVKIAKKGIGKNNEHIEAAGSHLLVGADFHRRDEIDSALVHYRNTLVFDSNNIEAQRFMGLGFYKQKNYDSAKIYLEQALVADTTDIELAFYLGESFYMVGQLHPAMMYLTRYHQVNPNSVETNFLVGLIWKKQGNLEFAKKLFQRTIQLNPDHAEAHKELGILSEIKGEKGKAINHWAKSLMKDKNNKEAMEKLKKALQKAHQKK